MIDLEILQHINSYYTAREQLALRFKKLPHPFETHHEDCKPHYEYRYQLANPEQYPAYLQQLFADPGNAFSVKSLCLQLNIRFELRE